MSIEIKAEMPFGYNTILTDEALEFLATLHRAFNGRRRELLAARAKTEMLLQAGWQPDFLEETASVRAAEWRVAPVPQPLQKRWVEITGPTDRKMVINALNSGADVFMADFEDANVPTWSNMIEGQINLRDAINRQVDFESPEGKFYTLNPEIAVLMVRPRGWHLDEAHLLIDGEPMSGSLFDFGLYVFHNAATLVGQGMAPYFYLPKLESYLEARLWNDAFNMAQDELGLERGTFKATVLLEHILLSFQIDEVLYELRDHIVGINAGRWDYIFSAIKKFRTQMVVPLPDRAQITMGVSFMKAYTDLLVQTCHKRGAHAMGGMAAFIPSRRDEAINKVAFEKVRADKQREVNDGFDGTWVAHPDMVSLAREVFAAQLGEQPHQQGQLREDVTVEAAQLINFTIPDGSISEAGIRNNINVALQYIESWLQGRGAVAIFNLMEDAATAEISRSQLWQWLHTPQTDLTAERYTQLADEEQAKLKDEFKLDFAGSRELLDEMVLNEDFHEFLTLLAYPKLEG